MTQPSIVLLPGSGLGPWIWEGIDLGGHLSIRVDYSEAVRANGTLDDYVEGVISQMDQASNGPVMLVGHSIGTIVAQAVAARLPRRVEAVLSVAGVVPVNGKSFFSAFGFPQSAVARAIVQIAGTRPPESMLRNSLAKGLDTDVADQVVARFAPESKRLFRAGVPQLPESVHRGYLFTTEDAEVPSKMQRQFAARLGATHSVELPTGHLPMLEDPVAFSRVVLDFVGTLEAHPTSEPTC